MFSSSLASAPSKGLRAWMRSMRLAGSFAASKELFDCKNAMATSKRNMSDSSRTWPPISVSLSSLGSDLKLSKCFFYDPQNVFSMTLRHWLGASTCTWLLRGQAIFFVPRLFPPLVLPVGEVRRTCCCRHALLSLLMLLQKARLRSL